MSNRCKHGMIEQCCSFCNQNNFGEEETLKRRQHEQNESIANGSASAASDLCIGNGFVLVYAKRGHTTHSLMDRTTRTVHIHGHPYVWLIEEILVRCPNLEKIQLIPSMAKRLTDNHRQPCALRNVEIVTGHARPELAWDENDSRICNLLNFYKQQTFLQTINGEQKTLWDELQDFGFEETAMVIDYFGLTGNDPVPQARLLDKYGFRGTGQTYISTQINGVIKYLNPEFRCGIEPEKYAVRIRNRVQKIRKIFERKEMIEQYANTLGLDSLPTNLKPALFEQLEFLVKARLDGRLARLAREYPRHYKILCLRFGYRLETQRIPEEANTLQKIGELLNNLTRERIRQLEEVAFDLLDKFPVKQ